MVMELSPDLLERAAKELNETPASRAAGLQALNQYYEQHPEERPHRTDDAFLLMFLRHAKFDVAKARGRLAAMERWIRDCRDELGDLTALRGEMFKELYSQKFVGVLGQARRTHEGACITVLIPGNMKPLEDPAMILKWDMWTLYRAVHEPYLQVCGKVVLESFDGFSLLHAIRFQQLPSAVMKKHFRFQQEVMPLRLRGIWLVRPVKWISVMLAIARPFMSSKVRQRMRSFGGDLSELFAEVDPAVLPTQFGGSCPDCGEAWLDEQLRKEVEEDRRTEAEAAARQEAAPAATEAGEEGSGGPHGAALN